MEGDGQLFTGRACRESILKTAKALVEDTKTLVAGAASSQEQLAVAAQNAVTTILQLAEVGHFRRRSPCCEHDKDPGTFTPYAIT